MIQKLGDNDSAVRDKIEEALIEIGKPAYELLKKVAKETEDAKIKSRIEKIIYEIEWVGIKNLNGEVAEFDKGWKTDRAKAQLYEIGAKDIFKNFRIFCLYKVPSDEHSIIRRRLESWCIIKKLEVKPIFHDTNVLSESIALEKIEIKSAKDATRIFVVFQEMGLCSKLPIEYFEIIIDGKAQEKGYRAWFYTMEKKLLKQPSEKCWGEEYILDFKSSALEIRLDNKNVINRIDFTHH